MITYVMVPSSGFSSIIQETSKFYVLIQGKCVSFFFKGFVVYIFSRHPISSAKVSEETSHRRIVERIRELTMKFYLIRPRTASLRDIKQRCHSLSFPKFLLSKLQHGVFQKSNILTVIISGYLNDGPIRLQIYSWNDQLLSNQCDMHLS